MSYIFYCFKIQYLLEFTQIWVQNIYPFAYNTLKVLKLYLVKSKNEYAHIPQFCLVALSCLILLLNKGLRFLNPQLVIILYSSLFVFIPFK